MAADAIDRLCTRRSITYTALMQGLGEAIADDPEVVPESVIQRAKQVDAERRSRR
jgi:hypothetical protein